MTERTSMRVWVYDCPAGQRAAALAALDDLTTEFVTGLPADQLDLTEPYYTSEARPGTSRDVADALRASAPGAAFLIREYPEAGNPGLLHAYTPALGSFSGECSAAGDVVLNRDAVHQLLAADSSGAGALRMMADIATGQPWVADFTTRGPGRQ